MTSLRGLLLISCLMIVTSPVTSSDHPVSWEPDKWLSVRKQPCDCHKFTTALESLKQELKEQISQLELKLDKDRTDDRLAVAEVKRTMDTKLSDLDTRVVATENDDSTLKLFEVTAFNAKQVEELKLVVTSNENRQRLALEHIEINFIQVDSFVMTLAEKVTRLDTQIHNRAESMQQHFDQNLTIINDKFEQVEKIHSNITDKFRQFENVHAEIERQFDSRNQQIDQNFTNLNHMFQISDLTHKNAAEKITRLQSQFDTKHSELSRSIGNLNYNKVSSWNFENFKTETNKALEKNKNESNELHNTLSTTNYRINSLNRTSHWGSVSFNKYMNVKVPLVSIGDGHYYISDTYDKSWYDARDACRSYGLELAALESWRENKDVVAYWHKKINWDTWIGGNDIDNEGSWRWSLSNKPFSYSNWYSGKPDGKKTENCTYIDYHEIDKYGSWDDYDCSSPKYFICELNNN